MAKAISKKAKKKQPKLLKESDVVKSLKAAAKILNTAVLTPAPAAPRARRAARNLVTVYHVWCPDEHAVIGSATTDKPSAIQTRDDHNADTGHVSRVIPS